MHLYGLIGYTLDHSFSSGYFNDKFRALGLTDYEYRNFPLMHVEELTEIVEEYPDLKGLNVTIPYKEAVFPFLDSVSAEAQAIGAVNVICIGRKGLAGHNTDWVGFTKSVQPWLESRRRKDTPHALILGTGGAAKAVAFALTSLGIEYSMVSRGESMGYLTYAQLSTDVLSRAELIINATPLGMFSNAEQCPAIDYNSLGRQHFLFDLVYNPEKTLFLQKGELQGARIKNGYEMLVAQAEAAWSLWSAS